MMLNLSIVRTFVTLVETGSFVETAKRLDMAQPTVSQQIQKLEKMLGAALIQRSHSFCSPTRKGLSVLPYAHALLRSADRFATAAQGDHICIGCSGNIATYFIASEIKDFIASESDPFSWDVVSAPNPDLGTMLENGEIDLAVTEWPDMRPGMTVIPWRSEPLVVVMPPDHPRASARRIGLEDLLKLDLIGGERGSGTGTLLLEVLGERAAELRIQRSLHSTEAVKNAVRAGLGSSIMLQGAVIDEVKAGQLAMLTVEGVELAKTFHIALPSGLPADALPARLAAFLGGPQSIAA